MMRNFGLVSVIWLRMWKSYTFIAAAAFVLTLCSSTVLAQSYLSISDFSTSEGNSGTTNFDFTVSLSPPSSKTVTV